MTVSFFFFNVYFILFLWSRLSQRWFARLGRWSSKNGNLDCANLAQATWGKAVSKSLKVELGLYNSNHNQLNFKQNGMSAT